MQKIAPGRSVSTTLPIHALKRITPAPSTCLNCGLVRSMDCIHMKALHVGPQTTSLDLSVCKYLHKRSVSTLPSVDFQASLSACLYTKARTALCSAGTERHGYHVIKDDMVSAWAPAVRHIVDIPLGASQQKTAGNVRRG